MACGGGGLGVGGGGKGGGKGDGGVGDGGDGEGLGGIGLGGVGLHMIHGECQLIVGLHTYVYKYGISMSQQVTLSNIQHQFRMPTCWNSDHVKM